MIRKFLDTLDGRLRFRSPQLAFCTHYSWFGVVKGDRLGIEEVHLFYNRVDALLSPKLLTFSVEGLGGELDEQRERSDEPLRVHESGPMEYEGTLAFIDSDILCYHVTITEKSKASGVRARFYLPETKPRLDRRVVFDATTRVLTVDAGMPRTDGRDPDPDHGLFLCLVVPDAFSRISAVVEGVEAPEGMEDLDAKTDGPVVLEFYASKEDLAGAEETFLLGIGEGPSAGEIASRMARIDSYDSVSSESASMEWLQRALDQFAFDGVQDDLQGHYAKAAYQILSNTKSPRGRIKEYGVYPSRGRYCAHYLWDACFTNLGAAQFNMRLAEDFLLALCENQEPDGKIPQFVCATWNRPGESQPPLIAWSAWRLYEQYANIELIRNVYRPIAAMVDWWFTARDEDGDGVVEYQHALESGWDNSPRFDSGRIAAVDLNAYLNREIQLLGRMAAELGNETEAHSWETRASVHAERMMDRLFDREDGLFYDRVVAMDSLMKVMTPASFSPLWAGVNVPKAAANEMIVKYLLDPKRFFGSRPFPVVAYNDPNYEPDRWWRGPVWPNIAWSMIEALRAYGFDKEAEEAASRLIAMMTSHEEMNELYSSSTGEPLGAEGLCWTCAVFMDLAKSGGGGSDQ